MGFSLLNELKALPPLRSQPEANLAKAPKLEVSLIIPARNAASSLATTVEAAHLFLTERFLKSFEIILVPNPAPGNDQDRSGAVSEELARIYPEVKSCLHQFPPGKGAAIRTGFQAAQGKWILFTDSDLPYDLDFFDHAIRKLNSGYDLVTGNRRLPMSHFHLPVGLLRLVYGRHRLGLAFNRLVRWLLPISTTDTQSGIKALSRRLAQKFCEKQSCPGFLFDLEIFLTALGQGYPIAEFPVTLHLNSEKTTVRILRECILVAFWLTRITTKNIFKVYGGEGKLNQRILSRYPSLPFTTRLFLTARWWLTPYSHMASRLPTEGLILDLGCGHGLFALAAALHFPSRQVLGIDHDQKRIELGSQAVRNLPNIRIEAGNLSDPPEGTKPYSGIAMIDVMHYFEPEAQENLLKRAFGLLEKGGTLLVREVDPEGGIASFWNRLYEKIATGTGFTRAEQKGLHFRSQKGWETLLKAKGFKVTSERCSSFLFADILYTCERPQ